MEANWQTGLTHAGKPLYYAVKDLIFEDEPREMIFHQAPGWPFLGIIDVD